VTAKVGIKQQSINQSINSFYSDLQGIRTNAKKDGEDWILNGSKVLH
jgi:hypothetical protein